ncbi:MAG: MXAN_6640 family putative metalloprotease, partial [bacterium]
MKKNIFLIDTIAVVCFNLAVVYGQTAQILRSEEQAAEARQILQQYEMALRGELEQPIKCGFTAIALLQAVPSLASQFPALAKAMLQRPTLPFSYTTPSGRFKFHYILTGVHAVDPTSTIEPNVPDYVYEAGVAAERSYYLLIDSLGFAPHASDNGADGPEFDFYFQNDQSYGVTWPEPSSGRGSAYITIENDFNGFYTTGVHALRVTVAHEYFHAVQLNIRGINGDSFFFEISSTWFEDVAYDYVNDYIAYLLNRRSQPFGFFQTFGLPLNYTLDNWHQYGACIWLHYLVKKLGPGRFRFRNNVVYDFWQRSTVEPALAGMKTVLESSGYSLPFSEALREFGEWCFFTGARADTVRYFEEAKTFPSIDFGTQADGRPKSFRVNQDTVITASLPPTAIHVYRAARLGQDVRFFLQPSVPSSEAALWKITTISGDRTQGYSK